MNKCRYTLRVKWNFCGPERIFNGCKLLVQNKQSSWSTITRICIAYAIKREYLKICIRRFMIHACEGFIQIKEASITSCERGSNNLYHSMILMAILCYNTISFVILLYFNKFSNWFFYLHLMSRHGKYSY